MFRPCFSTEEEFDKAIPEEYKGDYYKKYHTFLAKADMVVEAAKVYILNNWEKIDDWTDCNVIIDSNNGRVEYYNHKESNNQFADNNIGRLLRDAHDERKEFHNPIRVVNEVVLDPTDGDFSMVINDTDGHLWIESGIIEIAEFIERKLNGMLTRREKRAKRLAEENERHRHSI